MPKYAALENGALYTLSPLKFPFYATLCEPWCVAPTADGTGNFNEKYYKIPLTYLELTTFLTLEKILEKAKVPRAVEPVSDMCRVPWEKLAGLASAFTPFALPSLRDNESGKKPDANSVPDSEETTRLRRATRDFIQCGAERGERNNRLFQAVCDCIQNGWSRRAVDSLFIDVARQTGLTLNETTATIASAFEKVRCENGL